MRNPLRPGARWFLSSRFVTQVIWPAVVTLPTIIFGATQVQNLSAVEAYLAPMRGWFNQHPWVAIFCIVWTIVLQIISWWAEPIVQRVKQSPEDLTATELGLLLSHFAETVGAKLDRCGRLIQLLNLNPTPRSMSGREVLDEITDPSEQMRLLVDKIYLTFLEDLRDRRVELKVVLAKMDGINVEKFALCSPRNHLPVNSATRMNQGRNGFRAAVDARQMLIIPDVLQDSRSGANAMYSAIGNDPKLCGSMICYPLQHSHLGKIPYVLSIKCKRKNHFTEESRLRYEYLISPFADRILLEYSLLTIKEKIV